MQSPGSLVSEPVQMGAVPREVVHDLVQTKWIGRTVWQAKGKIVATPQILRSCGITHRSILVLVLRCQDFPLPVDAEEEVEYPLHLCKIPVSSLP